MKRRKRDRKMNRTCIFSCFSCAWARLTRSATLRNLLREFFTKETADLHLLRASMERSLSFNSNSFKKPSINNIQLFYLLLFKITEHPYHNQLNHLWRVRRGWSICLRGCMIRWVWLDGAQMKRQDTTCRCRTIVRLNWTRWIDWNGTHSRRLTNR